MKRVSDVQSKKSLRTANEDRQYGNNAVPRFGTCAGKIIDLFAQYVEDSMTVPPKGGRGCRVQKEHIDLCFGKFYQAMREFMDGEEKSKVFVIKDAKVLEKIDKETVTLSDSLKEEVERLKGIIQENTQILEDDASLYQDMIYRINELEEKLGEEDE
tara:strand:+ start:6665 stop:7135 length:471 start_codon:yes stop_codon:yes gene_type:complete